MPKWHELFKDLGGIPSKEETDEMLEQVAVIGQSKAEAEINRFIKRTTKSLNKSMEEVERSRKEEEEQRIEEAIRRREEQRRRRREEAEEVEKKEEEKKEKEEGSIDEVVRRKESVEVTRKSSVELTTTSSSSSSSPENRQDGSVAPLPNRPNVNVEMHSSNTAEQFIGQTINIVKNYYNTPNGGE